MTEEFHEFPDNWAHTTIGEAFEIFLGQSPPSRTYNDNGNGLPFFQGKAEFGKLYPAVKRWCTEPKRIAEKGDILLSVRAPVGPTNINPEKSCIGRGLAAIRGVSGVKPLFVLYLLRAFEDVLAGKSSGTTFDAITSDRLRDTEIPLPPLAEQIRIISKLEELFSKLDAAVESLQKTKVQLGLYQQSLLKNAFEGGLTEAWRSENRPQKLGSPSANPIEKSYESIQEKRKKSGKRVYKTLPKIDEEALPKLPNTWVWARTEELIYVIDYRGRTPPYSPKGIPHLRSSNIRDGKIIWEDLRYVSQETYEKFMVRGTSQQGDLLFTTEAPLGEVAFVPNSKFSLAQRLMILRPNNLILDPRFLFYQIMSPRFQGRLKGRGTGTTVTGVSYGNFRLLELAIPPLEEQHVIADELDIGFTTVNRITKEVEQALKKSSVMDRGILRKAFEGELVPQDPSEEPAIQLLERIKDAKKRGVEQPRLDKW